MGRPRATRFVALAVALTIAAIAGVYGNARLRAPATDHAVRLVPRDARAYLHAFLKPSTKQRRALRDLLQRFPATDEEDEARDFATDVLREVLGRFDVTVAEDAGEWLGDEAAAYLPDDDDRPVLLLAAEDEDIARAEVIDAVGPRLGGSLGDETHRNVAVELYDSGLALATVDGFIVLGAAPGVRESIDASLDGALDDASGYAELVADLPEHRIALAYATGAVIGASFDGNIALALFVTDDSVVLDAATDARIERPPLRAFALQTQSGPVGAAIIDLSTRDQAETAFSSLARALAGRIPFDPISGRRFVIRALAGMPEIVVRVRDSDVLIDAGVSPAVTDREVSAQPGSGLPPLLRGYSQLVRLDGAALPRPLRAVLATGLDPELGPVLANFVTLNLGVRQSASHVFARLVLTFAPA